MISVSVFPFPPESSLSYIRMVVVPMRRCRIFVVVLVPPVLLVRVGDIPVYHWSINSLSPVHWDGLCSLIFRYSLALLRDAMCSMGNICNSCLIILALVPRGTPRIRHIP